MAKSIAGVVTANPQYHGLDFQVDAATGAVTEVHVRISYDIVDMNGLVIKREASSLPVPFGQASPEIQGALQTVWDGVITPKLEEYA